MAPALTNEVEKNNSSAIKLKVLEYYSASIFNSELAGFKMNEINHDVESRPQNDQVEEEPVDVRLRKLRSKQEAISRRLKNLQLQQLLPHINSQLTHFVQSQKSKLQNAASLNQQALQPELEHGQMKNLPTNELVKLVRIQQKNQKSNSENSPIVKLDGRQCERLDELTGRLSYYAAHHRERTDPDATDSSTDAESSDDTDIFDPALEAYAKMRRIHIRSRADFTWSRERASVAARWSWYRAQVSDLEYRVRHNADLYRRCRKEKQPIILQEPAIVSKIINVPAKQAAEEGSSNETSFSPLDICGKPTVPVVPNGLRNHLSYSIVSDVSEQCARHKTLKQPLLKNRKLIRTCDVSNTSNEKLPLIRLRANRLSTINCRCLTFNETYQYGASHKTAPSVCLVCNGRRNHKDSVSPSRQSRPVRISLLDQAYHPVLGTNQDIAAPLVFNELQRSGKYRKFQSAVKRDLLLANSTTTDKKRKNRQDKIRRTVGANSKANSVAMKIRNKYGKDAVKNWRNKNFHKSSSLPKSIGRVDSSGEQRESFNDDCHTPSHINRSRLSSSSASRKESAFDINNIVIPHHMAACTRLERLNYKEISVPLWKKFDEVKNGFSDEEVFPPEEKRRKSSGEEEEVDVMSTNSPVKFRNLSLNGKRTEDEYFADNSSNERFEKLLIDQEELERQKFSRLSAGTDARRPSLSGRQSTLEGDDTNDEPVSLSNENSQEMTERIENGNVLNEERPYDTTPFTSRTFPLKEEEYQEMKDIDAAMTNTANTMETSQVKLPSRVSGARLDFVSSDEEEYSPFKSVNNVVPCCDANDGDEDDDDEDMADHVTVESSTENRTIDSETETDEEETLMRSYGSLDMKSTPTSAKSSRNRLKSNSTIRKKQPSKSKR
ncbi:DgyrCDS11154 [Dimorphilus gyrociliatus]|uniref:DgyrCDS11154 n=1 Tax=Dimorphilus gyrociliatus TaxID=2664684 RepID=A0A7I8W3H1_9ANNE|nr:DgyrCDS11154 [Dimorphilus gyrociliatus]